MRFAYMALFGVAGVLARYAVHALVTKATGEPYPYGTFLINITGAFLIGVVYVFAVDRAFISNDLRLGIMVGFLGGYTTFSSYCLETFQLINDSKYLLAAAYLSLSPVIGLAATVGGVFLTRALLKS